jgi:lipopolysaccharide export system protein LptA
MRSILAPVSGRVLLLLMLAAQAVLAQKTTPATPQDTTQKLKIETSEQVEGFSKGGHELRKLSGNVRLRQENTLVYCDTAIIDDYTNNAYLKGNVILLQGDSVRIFADSAHYVADIKTSDLFSNVVLVNGKQQLFTDKLRYDMANKIATYHTGATLSNGKSQLVSKHGYYHVNDKMVFFKGNVLVTDPDFTMRTDTMSFNTEKQTVYFLDSTLISERNSKIYTEGGFYDIENNFAEFDKNPQYLKEGQIGKARKMRYNGATKEYILEGDAVIDDPAKKQKTTADFIRYLSETKQTILRGNAHYQDSTRNITGPEIHYNEQTKSYEFIGRGRVSDPPNIIEADSLNFNEQLGNGLAMGSVNWQDTANNVSILAFRMDYNKKSDYLNAFGAFGERGAHGRPLMKSLVDKDTMYMSADTLTSYKPDSSKSVRLLLAHRDVRIFKSDLQGICDSLTFSSADSIFRFYKLDSLHLPILWSDTSQFSGDTIRLQMKNKHLDRLWLRKNALVINSEEGLMFNQIKGRNTTAFFSNNKVREMLVEGNAEAVYYAIDDKKAYVGVNETACSEMRLFFTENKVDHIRFYTQPAGKFTPMKKAGKESKKLKGFFWEKVRRPRSVGDLLKP